MSCLAAFTPRITNEADADFEDRAQERFVTCRYEGTYEINTLVAGRGATGLAAFKAPAGRHKAVGSAEGVH